jgi:hypothetical protein
LNARLTLVDAGVLSTVATEASSDAGTTVSTVPVEREIGAALVAEGPEAVAKLVAHARDTGHTPFVLRLLSYLLSLDLSVDTGESKPKIEKVVARVTRKVSPEVEERALVV